MKLIAESQNAHPLKRVKLLKVISVNTYQLEDTQKNLLNNQKETEAHVLLQESLSTSTFHSLMKKLKQKFAVCLNDTTSK